MLERFFNRPYKELNIPLIRKLDLRRKPAAETPKPELTTEEVKERVAVIVYQRKG